MNQRYGIDVLQRYWKYNASFVESLSFPKSMGTSHRGREQSKLIYDKNKL